MSMKFSVRVSQDITERDLFAVTIYTNFDFSKRLLSPILLRLKDGTCCHGILLSEWSRPAEEGDIKGYLLSIKSDEIQNPESAVIESIEVER